MEFNKEARLLIISNNVLSTKDNNGKTIFSYIDKIPSCNVAQLYFNSKKPTIEGYKYFQLSDKDILKGILLKRNRGRRIDFTQEQDDLIGKTNINEKEELSTPKNCFMRIMREICWYKKWKSNQLDTWLDEINPTAVFFVGGDSIFAYDICNYIVNKYKSKFSLYITDDYICPRRKENFFMRKRRLIIKKKMELAIKKADNFFTISNPMKEEYKKIFGKDSDIIVNMTESLKTTKYVECNEKFNFTYLGSLYYGRDDVCGKIAQALEKYNEQAVHKAYFRIYTNDVPSKGSREKFEIKGTSEYCGTLDRKEVKKELNKSSVLVFVESFEKEQIEKTKYSLSTKVPEYLSVGKPILAVGPKGIGSMDYLSDCAVCVNNENDIEKQIYLLLSSEKNRYEFSRLAEEKFKKNHNKDILQNNFLKKIL